jgi:hypothetical protein
MCMLASMSIPELLEHLWSVGAALPGRESAECNEIYRQVVREILRPVALTDRDKESTTL